MWGEGTDYNEFADTYSEMVLGRLREIIDHSQMSRTEISERSGISQSGLSKLLRGETKLTLQLLAKICRVLGVNPGAITDMDPEVYRKVLNASRETKDDDTLVSDPKKTAFKGYFEKYNVYFYSTVSSENMILQGEIKFEKSADQKECLADMILYTGKKDREGNPISKHYTGTMVISLSMSACYCILTSRDIGEMCFLVFNHMFLLNESLRCRMACATTVSAGGNRRPTMHRVLLCVDKLNVDDPKSDDFKFIGGQLMLNNSEILISQEELKKMQDMESVNLSESEMKELEDIFESQRKDFRGYFIDEERIRNAPVSLQSKIKYISLLRKYSESFRYNKVSTRTDEYVYEYILNRNESTYGDK